MTEHLWGKFFQTAVVVFSHVKYHKHIRHPWCSTTRVWRLKETFNMNTNTGGLQIFIWLFLVCKLSQYPETSSSIKTFYSHISFLSLKQPYQSSINGWELTHLDSWQHTWCCAHTWRRDSLPQFVYWRCIRMAVGNNRHTHRHHWNVYMPVKHIVTLYILTTRR